MPKLRTSTGVSLYYEQHGHGPDVVLISGLSSDHTVWVPVVGTFAKKYRVTIFDNRGAGQSDAPDGPYTIQMMAQDTAALMDALSLHRTTVIGHSMGGMILQRLCLDHPQKIDKAVLTASTAVIPPHATAAVLSIVRLREANVPLELIFETVVPWLYAGTFLHDQEKVTTTINMMLANPYPQSLNGFKAQVDACKTKHLSQHTSNIAIPTLVIAGRDDVLLPLYCSEHLHHHIQNSQMKVIADCGHMVQIEQPDIFFDTVTSFLGH